MLKKELESLNKAEGLLFGDFDWDLNSGFDTLLSKNKKEFN